MPVSALAEKGCVCPLTLAQRKKQASWIRKSAGLATTRAGFRFQLCFMWLHVALSKPLAKYILGPPLVPISTSTPSCRQLSP